MIVELSNFVNSITQDKIEEIITSKAFPWFYHSGTVELSPKDLDSHKFVVKQGLNPPQLVHVLINDSETNNPFFPMIQEIIQNLANHYKNDLEIIRAKFNMLHKSSDGNYHYPHADTKIVDEKILTAIYYVNASDGGTYVFENIAPYNEEELVTHRIISPEKGKIIIFDAIRLHASSSPVQNELRLVLNIVFKLV